MDDDNLEPNNSIEEDKINAETNNELENAETKTAEDTAMENSADEDSVNIDKEIFNETVDEETLASFLKAKEEDNADIIKESIDPEEIQNRKRLAAMAAEKEEPKEPEVIKEVKKEEPKDNKNIIGKLIYTVTGIFTKLINAIKNIINKGIYKFKNSTLESKLIVVKRVSFILIFFIALGLSTMAYATQEKIKMQHVELDNSNPNNITFENIPSIRGQEILLNKVLISSSNTIFQINNLSDFRNYNFQLVDQLGNYYAPDTHYLEQLGSLESVTLAFEPINHTNEFYLIATSKTSDDKFSISMNTSNLINNDDSNLYIKTSNSDEELQIENTDASPITTIIGYTLNNSEEDTKYITDNAQIYLYEEDDIIAPKVIDPYTYDFNNEVYLESSFGQVEDKDNTIKLTIDGIQKFIDINDSFTATDLYLNNGITYNYDNYDLVFEGIRKSEDTAVLVYHVDDKNDYNDYKTQDVSDRYPDRQRGKIDAELIVTAEDGSTFTVERYDDGSTYYGEIGGDLVFKDDRLDDRSIYDFEIKVNNALIDEPRYAIDVPVESNGNAIIEDNIDYIEKSFESRLAYMAQSVVPGNIVGFEDSIITDDELMNNYILTNDFTLPNYDANVSSFSYDNDNIYCVVNESFSYVDEYGITQFIEYEHAVIYNLSKSIITSDKII